MSSSSIEQMWAEADRNADGDLVFEREVKHKEGHTQTRRTNLTALFTPGARTSGDVSVLVIEAELVADGVELDNPAKPATADVAEAVIDRLDEDVRPAWEVAG